MAQFKLKHSTEKKLVATYGWDRALGYFVEVPAAKGPPKRARAEYDAVQPGYDHAEPLKGALYFLAAQGFFSIDQLEEAISASQHQLPEEMEEPLRTCAQVVTNFKRAAD